MNTARKCPPACLPALGLALMVGLTLATRLPFIGHPAADHDEQLYSLIGQHMLTGAVPYVDLWDRKPVGLFLIFAAAHVLGGAGAAPYQWLAVGFTLAGGWLMGRLARRIVDPVTAAFAASLYPLLMAIYGSHSAQSEVFHTPMMMGMAELVLSGCAAASPRGAWPRFAAAMALGGLALQVKYTVLPVCLWLGAVALRDLWRRGVRPLRLGCAAVAFGVLGLLPTMLVAQWYAAHGALQAFVFANFVSIHRRAPMPMAYLWAKQVTYLAPLVLFAGGGVVMRAGTTGTAWGIALGWLAAALAGLMMGTTIYPYYFAALVPAVLLVAMPMLDCSRMAGRAMLAGMILWLLLAFDPVRIAATVPGERQALARIVAAARPGIGNPAHPLYVYDGPTALYDLVGSPLPTRFIYPDHLNNALEARALGVDPAREVARILAGRPGAIVTSSTPLTVRNAATACLLSAELARHYRLVATTGFDGRPIAVYLRR